MNTNKWKQSGRLCLWRYEDNPKNYRGWHFTGDAKGIQSLLELIDLMIKAKDEEKRTISIQNVTANELRVPNCRNKAISTAKLILLNKKDKEDYWNISEAQAATTIAAGDKLLLKLRNGLTDIQNNKDDYFIGNKDHELWFWKHSGG